MAKVPVNNNDKLKTYYKYYLEDIYSGPAEAYARIGKGPGNNADALLIKNRNDLFKPGYLPGESGYWLLNDGTALIANLTRFPGVTGEIFDWWFAWHPLDRLRYAIWDADDHYDVQLADPAKARDTSLSLRERHWGSVHYIWEDIGLGGVDLLRINFEEPSKLGYDVSLIDTEACNTLICANVIVYGNDKMPDVPVVMTHFLRPVAGGSELRSRFWFGWQIVEGKPVKAIPDGTKIPEVGPKSLLQHNVKEFSNLARILPSVYAEERNVL